MSLTNTGIPTYPDSIWVRQHKSRYTALVGLYIVGIERIGPRWHAEMISIINGEIVTLETRRTLSIMVNMVEQKASEHSEAHTNKKED